MSAAPGFSPARTIAARTLAPAARATRERTLFFVDCVQIVARAQHAERTMHGAAGMNPKTEALKARTMKFALNVLDFVETIPNYGSAERIADQLTDSGTSVGANYRAACRARSDAEFAAKIGLVLEEADESLFWLELSEARSLGSARFRAPLLQEAGELTAIFAASSITIRESLGKKQR